jgi:outer membrane protein assembly factor BamB
MASVSIVYVGIKGSVVALDRASGSEVWRVDLKGGDFVNVLVIENDIFAAAKGEVFCLDQSTGQVKWHNPLKGLGWGLVSIAVPGGQTNPAPPAQKRRQEQQAAAAAAAASS